jgi:Trypsin-like peptidase domain
VTIPNDALRRCWIDVSATNPLLVSDFRPCLFSLMAFGSGREPKFTGTGFIIAGSNAAAFAVTAKHVLTEGVIRVQRPMPAHSGSALFVPDSLKRPSIDPQKLKIVWMGSEYAGMLNVSHVNYNDTLDIAFFVVTPQEQDAPPFQPREIPLDTSSPKVGDVVHLISTTDMGVSEIVPPRDTTGVGQTLSLQRSVNIRIGTVTAVHPNGFRQYKWPCFTTSIPAEPGMSGGFVYLFRVMASPLRLVEWYVPTTRQTLLGRTGINAVNPSLPRLGPRLSSVHRIRSLRHRRRPHERFIVSCLTATCLPQLAELNTSKW